MALKLTRSVWILGGTALILADADFADVIQVEALDLAGTAAQMVTLRDNTNAAFATGITVTTDASAASLNLQGGSSTVSINATGTNNTDTLIGGSVGDTLNAGSGGGSVSGGSGADNIRWSGTGNTTVSGGNGNDLIDPDADQTGADLIAGDAGNDTIYGGGGNDTILGGEGNDSIKGEDGTNVIWGGKGQDAVIATTPGSVDRVIIVGDLTDSTTVDSDKLTLINSTIDTLLGYDHPTLTNAYTTDVVAGETINFDSTGNDILYTFGDVDLSNVTITGNYSIVTHSSLILNESDFDNIQEITFVGDSLHKITVVDDTSKVALSNDDQIVAFETWAEDLDGSGNRVANAKTQLAFTVAGSKFRVGDFDSGGAEYTFVSTVTEPLLYLVIYGGTDGTNDRIIFNVAGAANISSAAISGIETLVLNAGSNSITMTAAQHNGFTGSIIGSGSTDQITLTTVDSINASSSVEQYNITATSTITLGALTQNVEEIGTEGDTALVFGAGAYSGTFTNFEATDVLKVVDGTDISGVTGLDVGVLDFQNAAATITLSAAQNGSLTILNADSGSQTIIVDEVDTFTGDAAIEQYDITATSVLTLGALMQNVEEIGTEGDTALVFGSGAYIGTFTSFEATDVLKVVDGTDISGVTGLDVGVLDFQDGNATITLDAAQNGSLSILSTGADSGQPDDHR